MDQDEKTERGHQGPLAALAAAAAVPAAKPGPSRSTAPAGTPYPVVPNPPPAVPAPSASQPRTVPGNTARLLGPDPLDIDPVGVSSFPPLPGHDGPPLDDLPNDAARAAPAAGAGSITMGGTQRLEPVSPEKAAVAQQEIAKEQAEKKPDPPQRPAPTLDMPAVDPAAVAAHARSQAETKGAPADQEPGFLARLFAPMSIAVGLVFFAMGCMIGLIIEGRLIRFSVSIPQVATVSAPPPPASVSSGHTHPAAVSATAPAPHAPSVASGPAAPAPPASTPPTAGKPPGKGPPQGTGKGLQPIF